MKFILAQWYRFSLPRNEDANTPLQRERIRHAKLTSAFLLLIFITALPLAPIMIFDSPRSPSSPPIAIGMLCLLFSSFFLGRAGYQVLSAICVVAHVFLSVIGPLVTNPLDPTLIPLFNTLVIAIILAGALMPALAALIAGACSCAAIILIATFQTHTAAYQQMMNQQLYTVSLLLPVAIQVIVAIVVYVIMHNLNLTIRRADRAEEIAQLRQELMRQAQERSNEQEQLAKGIEVIAMVHAQVANGELHTRVPLRADNVLWQVAIPLNNLLNRLQGAREKAEKFDQMNNAAVQALQNIQNAKRSGRPVQIIPTGTPIDLLLIEYANATSTGTRERL